ncbi:alpha/beta hydrolase [Salsipaludibacter albus]|uniref:alpha/beta hydrolase n=1 Tax=Salsipaludibacter albus TaxID=2849650 RepID=UPI001EE4B820|nr:alpha/beta fold hydrolase [Salsipaludibacter albus]MBY5163327.1 alpha/beta fold hydrolase [Salsipaludibacter albus]
MRAREPDRVGTLDHEGTTIGWESFGDGPLTWLLLPTWTIVHSRFWKLQVHHLARHARVVTYDGPGNGRSDRSVDATVYDVERQAALVGAVLDATGTDRAILVSLSMGANWSLKFAADHPERVLGQVLVGASVPLAEQAPDREAIGDHFHDEVDHPQGWAKYNANHWRDDLPDFTRFFFDQCFTEPHSTKQREDTRGWAAETTPEVLVAEAEGGGRGTDRDRVLGWCASVDHPVLVVHGSDDRISPVSRGEALAGATGGELVVLEGSGHIPLARDPVQVNLLLDEFAAPLRPAPPARRTWTRGRSRRPRALMVSSPIGLGHATRDLATIRELRRHHPDLEVDWLAQHPVTTVLERAGERVHPASAELASESAHVTSESGEHELHCFQAWRRMDEILLADFMVFHDVVTATDYDLVIGDEAWDVDYFLHENPELKRFAYAWSTDFVGWLPMPAGGDRERFLTADYNAEMIEHIARHPRIRDLALFVGNPDDIVDDCFGPDLPRIRDWTEEHYDFPGYVTGFDPAALGDREEVRDELGYDPDEQVCIVTVGGSGIGRDLLDRVVSAFPAARRRVPGLRLVLVAGPRIDPDSFPAHEGLEVHGYVHELYRHLAVCDLAVVQGGLTTCMELTASRRPFVYLPLRNHFEQNLHVHHRLRNHGAGRRMDFAAADPDQLAEVIATDVGRDVAYRPVETDGAARAAAALAQLL